MTPRDAIDIATAALRWHTARDRRLAAGAEKRLADAAYKTRWTGDFAASMSVSHRLTCADAAAAETRRQERAAVRALAKACAKARNDLQAVDVLEAEPVRRPKSQVIAGTSSLRPQGGVLVHL